METDYIEQFEVTIDEHPAIQRILSIVAKIHVLVQNSLEERANVFKALTRGVTSE